VLDRVLVGDKASLIRGAISHLKSGQLASMLEKAAHSGTRVELLVHDTERRVPETAVARLSAAGVSIRRYVHPDKLPLHAKFLLLESPAQSQAFFGSFNFNPRSRYLNHEVLAQSRNAGLVATLSARFDAIALEADGFAA
jgi:phosphatidylserine/phosphatidylglycerophosphate/cardiolipin synthase-like enzyme